MTSRKEQLDAFLSRTLSETIAHIPLEKFAQCFPSMKKGKVIAVIHQQLIEFFEKSCKQEYANLIKERDLNKKLDMLDECIHDAEFRKLHGESEVDISNKQPQEILKAHLYSHKRELLDKLNQDLLDIDKENEELSTQIAAEEKAIEDCISRMQSLIQKLEKTVYGMNEKNLAKEAHDTLNDLLPYIQNPSSTWTNALNEQGNIER